MDRLTFLVIYVFCSHFLVVHMDVFKDGYLLYVYDTYCMCFHSLYIDVA